MQTTNPRKLILALFAFPVLCGFCCWGIGGALYVSQQSSINGDKHTTGTVTGLKSSLSTSTSHNHTTTTTVYAPIVQFRTFDEKLITYTANISSAPAAYQVGQQVDIYYDPNSPANTVIIGGQLNIFYGVFGIGGLFILVFGILAVIGFARVILAAASAATT